MPFIQFLFFGALGGLARGFVGAYKHSLPIGNSKKLDIPRLLIQIVGACVIGGVVGLIVDQNPITALASGYAGIDIISNVIKLKK